MLEMPHLSTSANWEELLRPAGRFRGGLCQRGESCDEIKTIQPSWQSWCKIKFNLYIYILCNYIIKYILTIGARNFYTLPCRFCWPIGGSIDISVLSVTSWVEFLRCLAEFLRPAASWMISANLTNNNEKPHQQYLGNNQKWEDHQQKSG